MIGYLLFGLASGFTCDFLFKAASNIAFESPSIDLLLIVISGSFSILAFVIHDMTTTASLPSIRRELDEAKRQIDKYKAEIGYNETALKARQEELKNLQDALERANSRPVETEKIAKTIGNTLVGNRLDEIFGKATKLREIYDLSCQLQSENEKLKADGRNQFEDLQAAKQVISEQMTEIEKLRRTIVEQRRIQHFMEEAATTNGFAPGTLRRTAKMLRSEHEGTGKPKNTPAMPPKEFVPSRPRR